MSRKTIAKVLAFCCVLGVFAVSIAPVSAQTAQSGSYSYAIRVVDAPKPVVLGQDEPVEKKGPNLFERMKRSISNWVRDDETEEPTSRTAPKADNVRPVTPISVPTTPPKPVTTMEVRRSAITETAPEETKRTAMPEQRVATERRTTADRRETTRTNTETPSRIQSLAMEADASDNNTKREKPIQARLEDLRKQIFEEVPEARQDRRIDAEQLESKPAPRRSPPRSAVDVYADADQPVSIPRRGESMREEAARLPEDRSDIRDEPRVARVTTHSGPTIRAPQRAAVDYWNTEVSESRPQTIPEVSKNSIPDNLPPLAGIDVEPVAPSNPWNRSAAPATKSATVLSTPPADRHDHRREPVVIGSSRAAMQAPAVSSTEKRLIVDTSTQVKVAPERGKATLVSPRIEVVTEGDSKAIVGHESTYRVRVSNRGGSAAEQVALTIEIPNWIEILPPDVSTGTTATIPKRENQESRDFVWKISRLEPSAEEQLVLHLVPQERKTVDLRIRYDFYKPSAIAKIVVEEPVLEMELHGPSEVLWGTKVSYKLLVRNTGNGDAEKVKLELLQTGSDMKSCDMPLLKAGEEQAIDVDVWTGKQEHIDINILATGAYELRSEVFKRVVVMRPEVSITIESAETQFVDSPAEFLITVRNDGTAPAENLELLATVPLGARYLSNTAGGQATPQNQIIWKIASIPVGEQFAATIVCEPKREGLCKLDAMLNDKNGLIASCSGSIDAEAVADLKMQLENPQGPIEVGQEAVFTIHVVNRGTKTAEDVEVIAAFARGLDPFAIEGANGVMSDGQVVFDKIPAISPGQTVTLKVKSKADRPGNHRIRTEVICPPVNAHLVYEQATYFFQRNNGKITRTGPEKDTAEENAATVPPTPLGSLRSGSVEAQPLRNAPTTAVKPEDPFVR